MYALDDTIIDGIIRDSGTNFDSLLFNNNGTTITVNGFKFFGRIIISIMNAAYL
jgi:hypothetical protein